MQTFDGFDIFAIAFSSALIGLCVLGIIAENVYKDYKRRKLKKPAQRITVKIRDPRSERFWK